MVNYDGVYMKKTKSGKRLYTDEAWKRLSPRTRERLVKEDKVPVVRMATIDYLRIMKQING